MKRIIFFLAILINLVILQYGTNSPVHAQGAQEEPASSGTSLDIFPVPNPEPGFLGQDHSYSVTFRGNGEAVVALKVALTNKGNTELSEISLRVPKVSPQEFFVYQVIKEPSCIRYLTSNVCAEYQEPDYYGYFWSKTKYQKAQSEFSGDTLKITLPQAVSSNKTGGFFVYYRAMGYAKKNLFGAYNFDFETFQVEDDIRNLTIGISTDSDLVLRGATGEVNYRFEDAGTSLKAVGGVAPAESSAIDSFYNQIGYGSLVKTASSLAPLESYTVSSSYADTRIKLYAKGVIAGVGIFLGILVVALIIVKMIFKKEGTDGGKTSIAKLDSRNIFLMLGVSFASSLLIAGYSFLAIVAATLLSRSLGYEFQTVFALLIVVISFAVYALLLFTPGIYLGVKKGIGWGIATIFLTVLWMFIFLGVGVLIYLAVKGSSPYSSPIIPLGIESTKQY